MKFVKLFFRPETFVPMLALTFASGVSITLVVARILWSGNVQYAFLIWNLFLAWVPLFFALLACEHVKGDARPGWRFLGFAGAWLLFFPNAPYIFTDVVHLRYHLFMNLYARFWVDLAVILTCALTGLVVGFISLYMMQSVVKRQLGPLASWVFIAAMAVLSSLGICIGRFLRFNSWDIATKPVKFYQDVDAWLESFSHPATIAFPLLFAAFLFTAYLMLYALTHLSEAQQALASKE